MCALSVTPTRAPRRWRPMPLRMGLPSNSVGGCTSARSGGYTSPAARLHSTRAQPPCLLLTPARGVLQPERGTHAPLLLGVSS
eukprot:878640-Pelagomonas_calceolata.AAC.5